MARDSVMIFARGAIEANGRNSTPKKACGASHYHLIRTRATRRAHRLIQSGSLLLARAERNETERTPSALTFLVEWPAPQTSDARVAAAYQPLLANIRFVLAQHRARKLFVAVATQARQLRYGLLDGQVARTEIARQHAPAVRTRRSLVLEARVRQQVREAARAHQVSTQRRTAEEMRVRKRSVIG